MLKKNFSVQLLEKAFDALRASFLQEDKNHQKDEKLPKKPWKFYKRMFFLKEEQENTKVAFTSEERETMITFYQHNSALLNHGILQYRD